MKKLITLTSLFITLNLFAQNNSLQFDGINDHINSGTINLSGSAITLETWVKADAFQSNFPYISQIAGTEASGNSAFLRLGDGDIPAGNKVQFVLQFGGSQIKLTSSSTLQTGQWYHIAGTYDGTNMKVYINGAQDASNSQSGSFTSNSTFYLATNDGSGRFLDGTLDEVRVWNDARTETEIRQNIYRELPDPSSETNLIAYYKLNESSGTTASDSKNNYDGTLTNMAGSEWVTESPFEAPKYALDFDGTNDYVQAGAIAFTGSTLTIEAWIRPRTFNDGSDANITDLVKDANEKLVLRIGDGGIENNRLQFVLSIGNTQYKLQANTLLSADTWYHVAAAYDGSNMKLYINGVEDNTTGRTGNIDAGAGNLLIGGNSGGRRLDGKMDEVRIWSTARSASEISSNMTSLLNGFETGLTAYYRFDDGTGTTLTDQKSTYNGTLTNMDNADWVNSYAMVLAEDATDISTTSFTANWDCPGTGSSFDDGYTIQYSTTSDFSSGNNTTTATSSETSKSITGLSAGTTYYYRVSGKRSGDATLEYSNVKSAATTSLISYIVSGAGSSEVNGTYVESGTYNGKTQYRLGSTDYYLRYNGYGSNRWEIWNDNYWETLYYTNVAGDTPPSTGWTTYFGDDPAPSVEISSPSIAYSASEFNESYDDDGSISNNITITCNNVDGVEFTGTNGDNFVTGGKVVVTNLPPGLTAVITRTDNLTLSVSLTGNATSHDYPNSVPDLTFTFQNSAFSNNDASGVRNSTKADLIVNFYDTWGPDAVQPPLQDPGSPYDANTNPYVVSSLAHLSWLSQNTSGWDKAYIQSGTIDASQTQYWDDSDDDSDGDKFNDANDAISAGNNEGFQRIGIYSNNFTGNYNGQYYVIKGLYIFSSSERVGFFGYFNGTVTNLGLIDADITMGSFNNGILTGQMMGGVIENCLVTGSIVSNSQNMGSITGYMASGTIRNCYSTASVSSSSIRIGGFLQTINSGTISNCYSTGRVSGGPPTGGFVATYNSGTVTSCYWDTETSGQTSSAAGTGYTTAQMKVQGNYSGWDFTNTWGIDANINDGYPYLKGFLDNISEPITQATDPACTEIGNIYANLSWTNGNGEMRFVFAKEGNSGTASPVDFNNYEASIGFGQGTQIGSTGWYCVYKGTGNSVSIKNLSPNTAYIFQVFEGNGYSTFYNFNTSLTSNSISTTTENSVRSNLALTFDGTDDYVSLPNELYNTNFSGGSAITIEYWFKGTQLQSPLRFQDGNGYLVAGWNSPPQFIISSDGGTNGVQIATDAAVEDNQWHHVACVWQKNTAGGFKTYLDGSLSNSKDAGNVDLPTITSGGYIGCYNASGEFINGQMDEIRIWNVARTAEQISGNMKTELTGGEAGLVAYYNMNSINKNILEDNTTAKGANQGTLFNGVYYSEADDISTLPVELTSFTAKIYENKVTLNWQTATEVDNYGFEIQRQYSGKRIPNPEWEKVGFVAGHGSSNSPKEYSFADESIQNGIYSYRLKQIDIDGEFEYSGVLEVEVNFLPKEFSLSQNYPNPFNPSTTIKYSIPAGVEPSYMTALIVYDILGNEVATLVNERQKSGNYEVKFNASNLASGIYLYRLQSGSFVQTRKLILLK